MKLTGKLNGEELELEIPEEAFTIPAGLMCARKWAESVGRNDRVRRRWTENGWLAVEYIAGQPFVTREGVLEFISRLKRGEFKETQPAMAH